jgi:hypothetical protein
MDTQGGTRPAWLDDPLLRALYSSDQIEGYWGRPLAKRTPQEVERSRKDFQLQASNAMKLRAAGMHIVSGTDTGQTRFFIGYFNHLDLESMVAMGLTPSEAIVAATRDAADIARVNAGLVAAGKSADFIVLDGALHIRAKRGNTVLKFCSYLPYVQCPVLASRFVSAWRGRQPSCSQLKGFQRSSAFTPGHRGGEDAKIFVDDTRPITIHGPRQPNRPRRHHSLFRWKCNSD